MGLPLNLVPGVRHRFRFFMLLDPHTDELVKLTYEAATDPSRWEDFLRLFSEAIHAPSAVFLIHDKGHQKANASEAIGVEPVWVKSYQEHFVAINPWLERNPFRRGVVAVGE